jgi:CRP-like cAMP-binding protein
VQISGKRLISDARCAAKAGACPTAFDRRQRPLIKPGLFVLTVVTCPKIGQIREMVSHSITAAEAKLAPVPMHSNAISIPSLFDGLSKNDSAALMAAAVMRRFVRGQTIIRADDLGTHLFLLRTGAIDYYRVSPEGQQLVMIRFFPGDTFGLASLTAGPMRYIGTAEAVRETELYVWERASVRDFAGKHPPLAENLLRIGLEYITLYSDRHLALVSDNTEDRLRHTISQLELRAGHRGLEIEITNERLASLADVGYYTVSRLLNRWKRKGAIDKRRGKLVIVCPEMMLDE